MRAKLLFLVMVVGLLSLLVVPAAAQEGEGGVIITSTFGDSPASFSQIYCTDTSCYDRIIANMYIGPVGANPETATIEPNQPGALALDWEVTNEGRVFTVNLRQDMVWSDGAPITAHDIVLDFDLMKTPEAQHPSSWIADAYIENLVALDDYTIEYTFYDSGCDNDVVMGYVSVLPSHILSQYAPEELIDLDFNLNPTVTSGAFTFGEDRPGEFTSIIGNDDYADAELGYVNPEGLIQVLVADQTVQIEKFLEGEINVLDFIPPNRKADVLAAAETGEIQVYEFPGNTWDYMGLNRADPNNPQPGLDEDGNRVDQGMHPIFADKLVRQALAHAINVEDIITGAVFGYGARMTAQITPGSWAYNHDLAPRAFDPDRALELLAEAGWVPGDDGRLVCQGCLYATDVDADFEGSPLEFELLTNAGNTRRTAVGTIIQDQLDQIGITVDFQTIEWNSLLDVTDAQTTDAFIMGWRAGYPDTPATVQLFGTASDTPGGGSNDTSFYNEEYYELEAQALSVPGCDTGERAVIYAQMQEIMQDEMPYVWLYAQDGMYAARSEVAGFSPWPAQMMWNVDTWSVSMD